MADFTEGTKRQVAELKFLIHDLRIEHFINNIIHFHVTLNTDLEIYEIDQAHAFHSDDLAELKLKTTELRRAFRAYSAAVKNYSPDKVILATGRQYIETIQDNCELVLNPLWGRFDRVISFLPDTSRSVLGRNHYRNNLRWICGVYYRIEYFLQDLDLPDQSEEFDLGHEIADYTNTVVYGYIIETSRSRVEIQVDRSATAVVSANRPRFRRMYFNLVMNAVDAMQGVRAGMIRVRVFTDGDQAVVEVRDNGTGMYEDKVKALLRDRETLDGELHSLGFVFVRETVQKMGGELLIDSTIGKGTTITIRVPCLPDREPPQRRVSRCTQYDVMPFERSQEPDSVVVTNETPSGPCAVKNEPQAPEATAEDWNPKDTEANCGRIVHNDYVKSDSDYPGCVFTIGVNYDLTLDTFLHKPYEQLYAINHEDLNPMLYDSTIRGRLEDNDDREPALILKEPHSVAAYFDLKEIDSSVRSREKYDAMVRDEYILIARKLLGTGLPSHIQVHVTSADRYLPGFEATLGAEPFGLESLSGLPLSTE